MEIFFTGKQAFLKLSKTLQSNYRTVGYKKYLNNFLISHPMLENIFFSF